MQLILAKNAIMDMTSTNLDKQGRAREIYIRHSIGRGIDRIASGRDLQTRPGGGNLCTLGVGPTGGRVGTVEDGAFSHHAFGHETGLRKAAGKIAIQAAGTQKRASGQPTVAAGADRPARGTSFEMLSRVRRNVETLPSHAHTVHRGHSRRPQGGGHRAYDPSRLVSEVQKERRAGGVRRPAELDFGQSRVGLDGLVALRPGQHALADHRSLQFPPADQADARRA